MVGTDLRLKQGFALRGRACAVVSCRGVLLGILNKTLHFPSWLAFPLCPAPDPAGWAGAQGRSRGGQLLVFTWSRVSSAAASREGEREFALTVGPTVSPRTVDDLQSKTCSSSGFIFAQ